MKVLSLFDGISCGRVALERAGIPVEAYAAYEVDEDAITVSRHNWPDIIQMGDVFAGTFSLFQGYDLLIGGSPCTHWSIAKGGGGRETEASGIGWDLFSQYVRAKRESGCPWFLYENNASMSNAIREQITECLGVEPVLINSADFSAQERKRLYWTNIPIAPWAPSGLVFSDIMEPDGFRTRSIAQYRDTYRWSADGKRLAWDTSGKGYYSQEHRARTPDSKMGAVCAGRAQDKGHVWLGDDTIRIIKMSELEKLQTLPVGYTDCLKSNERRGKGIGNGWTVDVIAHILKGLKR